MLNRPLLLGKAVTHIDTPYVLISYWHRRHELWIRIEINVADLLLVLAEL